MYVQLRVKVRENSVGGSIGDVCLRMYIYICIYMYVYVCLCIYIYIFIFMFMYVCICTHTHTHTHTHIYIYICNIIHMRDLYTYTLVLLLHVTLCDVFFSVCMCLDCLSVLLSVSVHNFVSVHNQLSVRAYAYMFNGYMCYKTRCT